MKTTTPSIIVHSGAGYFPDERNPSKMSLTKRAVMEGYRVLPATDDPVLAVEAATRVMEDDEAGNAGYGSVLTSEGLAEMDALIIRGKDLAMGGVGAMRYAKNPITVARRVMETTPHVLLVGEGAEKFAIAEGLPLLPNEALVSPRAKAMLQAVLGKKMKPSTETGSLSLQHDDPKKESGLGTVGAVAINSKGELAAATSTGGLCGKLPGRVGDTPIPGGGTLCDDERCGISATGLGESIMRYGVASRIATLIDQGMDPSAASLQSLQEMTSRIGNGDGGAIVITKDGVIGYGHNSRKMTWAYIKEDELRCGVQADQEVVEQVGINSDNPVGNNH